MQLVRNTGLSPAVKRKTDAPIAGGVFFALEGANDLPNQAGGYLNADAPYMLRHGTLFIGKAGTNPDWQQVKSLADLPKFKSTHVDDYASCSVLVSVTPFMPQFYFVPRGFRGNRIISQ